MTDENKTKKDTVKGWKDCPLCGEPLKHSHSPCNMWKVSYCDKCKIEFGEIMGYTKEEKTAPKPKPCPFCNRKNVSFEYYDFGREYTDTIDAETDFILIECECGCSLEVDVRNIPDVEDKKAYAIGKWNRGM